MQYELSSEVEKVANRVIKQHHPDLLSKKIHYAILDKKDSDGMSVAKWSKGHQIAAEIRVLTGDAAFLVQGEARTDDNGPIPVVLLKVYRLPWAHIKEEKTREALIDSQLCRLIYDDETGKPSVLEYDAKVHNSNLKRYGAWNREIEKLLDATKELPLFAPLHAQTNGARIGHAFKIDGENDLCGAEGCGREKDAADHSMKFRGMPVVEVELELKPAKAGNGKGRAAHAGANK